MQLAYAVTAHRVQGMTVEKAIVLLNKSFLSQAKHTLPLAGYVNWKTSPYGSLIAVQFRWCYLFDQHLQLNLSHSQTAQTTLVMPLCLVVQMWLTRSKMMFLSCLYPILESGKTQLGKHARAQCFSPNRNRMSSGLGYSNRPPKRRANVSDNASSWYSKWYWQKKEC